MTQEHEELSGIEQELGMEELLQAAEEESGIDESGIEEFHQATEEFVDVLSDVCSKYEIESEDIEAMNDGLEKVWDSVTMSEDYEELPEGIEEVEEVPELPEPEELEEEEDAQAE